MNRRDLLLRVLMSISLFSIGMNAADALTDLVQETKTLAQQDPKLHAAVSAIDKGAPAQQLSTDVKRAVVDQLEPAHRRQIIAKNLEAFFNPAVPAEKGKRYFTEKLETLSQTNQSKPQTRTFCDNLKPLCNAVKQPAASVPEFGTRLQQTYERLSDHETKQALKPVLQQVEAASKNPIKGLQMYRTVGRRLHN